jgi:DNA-binding Xre family transcriptional regulator
MVMISKVTTMTAKFRWRLKELREARNLSRMDIVRDAKISYATVQTLEREAETGRVDAPLIARLMRVLDCSFDELITFVEDDDEELRETVE